MAADRPLDPAEDESRLSALKRRLRERISTMSAGEKLPGLRKLGDQYGCSLGLVQMAVNQLTAEGFLVSEARRGVFIAEVSTKPRNIALVLPSLRLEQMDHIIRGCRMGLDGSDLQMVVQAAHDDFDEQIAILDKLDVDHYAGVIICPPVDDSYAPHIQALHDRGIPAVQATHMLHGVHLDSVAVDGFRLGSQGIEYLVSKGHRSIGIVGSSRRSATYRSIDDGVRSAIKKAGLNPDLCPIVDLAGFTLDPVQPWLSTQHWTTKVLQDVPSITAIYALNNSGGYGATRAAKALGKRVPQDISVLCAGADLPAFRIHEPPLTVIEIPLEEICRRAAARLNDIIHGSLDGTRIEHVPPQLVERASVQAI